MAPGRSAIVVLCLVLAAWSAGGGLADARRVAPDEADGAAPVRIDVLEDPSRQLSIDAVVASPADAFRPVPQRTRSFGFTQSALWFRVAVAPGATPLVLEVANPMLAEVDLYRPIGHGGFELVATGSARPVASREIASPNFVFDVAAGDPVTMYLRVSSTSAMRVPIRLLTRNAFRESDRLRALVNGFFYGGVLMAALFQLLLTVVTRFRGHLSFVFALLATAVLLLNLDGFGPYLVWPALYPYLVVVNAVASMSVVIGLLGFTAVLLNLRERRPTLFRAHIVTAVLSATLGLVLYNSVLAQALITAAFALMLGAGIDAWRSGYPSTRFFVVAWSVLLVGVAVATLVLIGVPVPFAPSAELVYKLSALPAIAMFSVSLAERVVSIRQTAEEAEAALRRHDETLVEVARGVVGTSGAQVFQSLVEHVARALEADVAFVGEVTEPERQSIQTVAVWAGQGPGQNFEYALAGSPCEQLLSGGGCSYPRDVASMFPADEALVAKGIQAYVGTPLFDERQQAVGLIVTLFRRPLPDPERVQQTLQIFASRAAAELERRRSDRTLREREELLRSIIDHSPAVTYVKDVEGRYLLVNRRFEQRARRLRDTIVGRKDAELFGEAALQFREHDLAALAADEPLQFEERDGDLAYLSTKVALRDANGAPWALVGVSTEINDYERLQAQARAAQRMEAFGQLAGGVAHDFNNLLTAVLGYIDLCETSAEPGSTLAEDLRQARDAGVRAARITDQLLAFARRQKSSPQVVDLNDVVRDFERLLKQAAGAAALVRTDLCAAPAPVRIDVGQFEQVILNLVLNARDAMPGGGTITVRTRVQTALPSEEKTSDSGRVFLDVSDAGHGIAPEHLPRIFEPFFTTKSAGRGTGLGLAMSHGIVLQAGGTIDVESQQGIGTTFTVSLPMSQLQPARAAAERPVTAEGGRETVLVVDDEASVKAFVRRVLAGKGYEVLVADDGREAIDIATAYPGRIDLVLTDVSMPDVNGRDVARAVRKVRPATRVMYMSGYAERALAMDGLVKDGAAFLAKPFTMSQLSSAVRHVIDSPDTEPRD